jgi:hypothetical protein
VSFIASTTAEDWTLLQWVLLLAFFNSIASIVNVDKTRQEMVFEYVTNGADADYSAREVAMNDELRLVRTRSHNCRRVFPD